MTAEDAEQQVIVVITGTELRRWRLAVGWKLSDLASKLGYSKTAVWHWEHGNAHVPRDNYERILAVFLEAMDAQRALQVLHDQIPPAENM